MGANKDHKYLDLQWYECLDYNCDLYSNGEMGGRKKNFQKGKRGQHIYVPQMSSNKEPPLFTNT